MSGALESELAKALFHNTQECSRVRFGSRNALMTGAMLATLTALCHVDTNWRKMHFTQQSHGEYPLITAPFKLQGISDTPQLFGLVKFCYRVT